MLESVMTMDEGARIYSPGGRLLQAGDRLEQPGLMAALELVAEEGGRTFYTGTLATALLDLVRERGGLVTRADLEAYDAVWREPVGAGYLRWRVLTRGGLSRLPETLTALPSLAGRTPSERVELLVPAFAREAAAPTGERTTNLVTVDGDGNACVVTSSLGLGSGDFLPGFDLHLNSMLGETDLVRGPLEAGERMESMMAPTLALGDAVTPVLAAGAAGGTRLRTALTVVLAGSLDEGLTAVEAVERPRFHPAGAVVNAEPGVDEDGLALVEARGWTVRRWPAPHHYFGGVSAITQSGAAGDPRRSGAARTLP
jgi:gamma-glutamyltranspeptidase/glutathione hydrolase